MSRLKPRLMLVAVVCVVTWNLISAFKSSKERARWAAEYRQMKYRKSMAPDTLIVQVSFSETVDGATGSDKLAEISDIIVEGLSDTLENTIVYNATYYKNNAIVKYR